MLRRLDLNEDPIDLVDFGDFRAWMLTNDLLYGGGVSANRKGASINSHYEHFAGGNFPKCKFQGFDVSGSPLTREFGYQIIQNYIRHQIPFDIIDVGAFMGDQALRYASFLRTVGNSRARVFAIDPSLSADLIPYNVELNRLGDWVQFVPAAIGPINGPLPFALSRGTTDSGRVVTPENTLEKASSSLVNSIVQCIRLDDFLERNKVENAFVKLDLEGYDAVVMRQIWPFLQSTNSVLAFELTVHDSDGIDIAADLMENHAVFDIGYFPNMFRLKRHFTKDSLWWEGVRTSPFGYTDVLAIPKSMPGFDDLMEIAERSVPVEATHYLTWSD